MILVGYNERKEFTLSNVKLSGFTVNTRTTSSILNGQVYNSDINFNKMLLKVILKRDGKQWVLIQDDLKTLGLVSNFYSMARRSFYQDHAWSIFTKNAAVDAYGESLIGFDIDFMGVLDLRGTDELLCEISIESGAFSTSVNASASYMEIKPIKSIGFEKYVPYIRSYSISAGERRRQFDLGNNVMRVSLLNFDIPHFIDPVVSTVTIASSKLDDTMSFTDLVASRYVDRPDPGVLPTNTIPTLDEFDQCFILLNDTELDKVNIDIQFNPANVTANNNILVVNSAYTDVKTLIEHDAKIIASQNEKIAELKQNGDNATIK